MSDDNFDIYGDLDDALTEPLQAEIEKKAAEQSEKLKEDENYREETEKIINELKTSNFQLKKNMSLLLATAKSEIERKDQQIRDLRREMDEIIFRKNKGSKKTCEKWSQTDKVEFYDNNRANSTRHTESNKLHDKHKSKETDDRHKRKTSPVRKYSDDYRRSSHKDEINGSRSKNYDEDRKSSHDKTKSRSPDRSDRKSSRQESLREDDLRKVLLKSKNHEKSSSTKESSKKHDDRREKSSSRESKDSKHKEKDRKKDSTKDKSKLVDDKHDKRKHEQKDGKSEKVVKEKIASPKKVKKEASTSITVECVPVSEPPHVSNIAEKIEEQVKDQTVVSTDNIETELEKLEVKSSNLVAKSDTNKNQHEVVTSQNEKEIKEEKVVESEKKEEISSNLAKSCQVNETLIPKTEEALVRKQKYVPIFEAKIFATPIADKPIETELPKIDVEKEMPLIEVKPEIKEETVNIPEDPPQNENKLNLSTESPNDSFESTKENSLNNSTELKKNKKRKIVTTEIESDGTVVWTITRKKRKTKEHS